MKSIFTVRLLRLLWVAALLLFVGVWLYPVSTGMTRLAGLILLAAVWVGLIALVWDCRPMRLGLLGFSAGCAVFLMLPARGGDPAALGKAYIEGLRRYEGVTYYWGGESPKGIDCSGLIRRGLIDALFVRGLQSFDGSLVRRALWLWWNDCTARDLGAANRWTTTLSNTPSLNALDHTQIVPGDLAVTRDGAHILAYLGGNRWIEADPGIERVVMLSVPNDSLWFNIPMNLVRWRDLQ